jgi:hypothetical protein
MTEMALIVQGPQPVAAAPHLLDHGGGDPAFDHHLAGVHRVRAVGTGGGLR